MTHKRVIKSLIETSGEDHEDTDGLDGDFRSILQADQLKTEFEDPETQNSFQAATAAFLRICLLHSSDQLFPGVRGNKCMKSNMK